ncbi:MAG: hypothetical protein AAGH78_06945 [Cyanobacteria bacterium P01_H01_bin.58]
MSGDGFKPFENNWAYIKTELHWLDRLLMLAVSRQRHEDKTVNRVAKSTEDKVTSHWWKGIIALNKGIDDREGPPPQPAPKKAATVSYSQHLEARIYASYEKGIKLALPELRDRCGLTEVEKNILLLALAPEINRRYGRLYNYLQSDAGVLEDLPTVDLCLRLLCRSDHAWQKARARLTASNSLISQGLVELVGDEDGTLLSQQVRVIDEVANYLLSDHPNTQALPSIFASEMVVDQATPTTETGADAVPAINPSAADTGAIDSETPSAVIAPHLEGQAPSAQISTQEVPISWDQLILPKTLISQLQHLSRQASQRQQHASVPGLIVLLTGAAGTGKTIAASAIAANLGLALSCVELETLAPDNYPSVLTATSRDDNSLLLVKQGEQWLGRSPQVDQTWLRQWWQWRKQQYGLTLVSAHVLQAIRPSWRQQFDGVLTFPYPQTQARRTLWINALPPEVKCDSLDWAQIAKCLPLTGGEITAIAQTVQLELQAKRQSKLTLRAFQEAVRLHQPHMDVSQLRCQRR